MMSGPKGTLNTTGIIGKNNIVIGDIHVTGQQINQNNSPSISPQGFWFEVRKPVESFTGRKRELEYLHEAVQCKKIKKEHKLTVISQVTSISGLGGIGKSEIARMYARKHGQDYDCNVMWINAESYGLLTESFLRLAKDKLNISTKSIDGQEKDINSIVQEVYRYFSKTKSLFIFDNAEKMRTEKEGDEGIDKFLPNFQSPNDDEPYIIITSRNQKWEKNIKVIPIDTFTEEEAIEFIKKELDISDESQDKEILELAKTLQCFPLALQQAVAYIKHKDEELNVMEKKFEIIDYLKKYGEKTRKLLNYHFTEESSNCYIHTTLITWEVTLENIKQKKHGQQALQVLETIAYFASENIPTKIFLELVKSDIGKVGSILQLLVKYSMVKLEKGVINIHRLVQQVIRLRLKEQQKEEETLKEALKIIKTSIEERDTDVSKYLPHAVVALNHASNDNNIIWKKELIEFSNLISNKLYNYITYQGGYAFALGIYQDVLNITRRVLGEEYPSTLTTRHCIATVLEKQGKYDEALGIYQDVLNIKKRVLGEEHPDTLATKNNMTLVFEKQGKYDEALGICQDVLNIRKRVLGEEHPDTLTTRHCIATVLEKQGTYDEALETYQDVLNIKKRVLGEEHHDTLATRNNMALVLEKQGKYDEALGTYQDVLNITERVLGKEHLDTLATKNNMAILLGKQGKYDDALENYQNILNIVGRVLGEEHPITLTTRNNMSLMLNKQGKCDEALGIYQDVLNIRKRVLGEEHPNTLTTRHCIASVLDKQGKYHEALETYQDVLNITERVLGEEHPDALETRHCIASLLDKQEKYDEALGIYQDVLNIRKRVLGEEHPDALETRHCIASVLDKQEKYDEALGIYQDVLNIRKRVLGEEHPDALETRHCIASVLDKQEKYDEALGIYQDVLNIRKRVLGEEHPDALETRHCIASLLDKKKANMTRHWATFQDVQDYLI